MQAVRMGVRRTRYLGVAKTALQRLCTAAALNLLRLDAFLAEKKMAKTRISHFATVAPGALAG